MVLENGLGVSGVVTDERQNPVEGAKVSFGEFYGSDNPTVQTSSDGTFVMKSLPAGQGHFTVMPVGFAPERTAIEVGTNSTLVTFELKPLRYFVCGSWMKRDAQCLTPASCSRIGAGTTASIGVDSPTMRDELNGMAHRAIKWICAH